MTTDRFRLGVLIGALFVAGGISILAAAQNDDSAAKASLPAGPIPEFAYPVGPPPPPGPRTPPAPNETPQHVPGSPVTFTVTQVNDVWNILDWYPNDHLPVPEVVAHGRKPVMHPCGRCHLANGQGRPENAAVVGLPYDYFVQQLSDFKNNLRRSTDQRRQPPNEMIGIAKTMTDAEIHDAATYFSSMKYKPWVRVVESANVPKTRVLMGMWVPGEDSATEPIGHRLLELPENVERTELRDSASGFVAYVPVGSIQRGEALVTTGGSGRTIRCGTCHGADLKGMAMVPPIAGRSPSYIVRALYDMQGGIRKGPWSQLMKEVVAKLNMDDMVAIAAYVSSRTP